MNLNYYQNMWVMSVFVNTPLLLRCAYQVRRPLPPAAAHRVAATA